MDRIISFVSKHLTQPSKVTQIKQGQNASIYCVVVNDEKYIVRLGYDTQQSGSSLEKATRVQQLLFKNKFKHCPEPIMYDSTEHASIERFVVGEQKPFSKYTKGGLDNFIVALTELHQMDRSMFQDLEVVNPLDSIAIYGTDRLVAAKADLPQEQDLFAFLDDELQKNISLLQQQKPICSKPFLIHGDIGKNCLQQADKAVLIDWEHARLSYSHELDYIKIHSHPSVEQFMYLVEEYAARMDIAVEVLQEQIKLNERIVRLNDVIWAAMRWGETQSQKLPNGSLSHRGNTFAELTFDRKKLFTDFMKGN